MSNPRLRASVKASSFTESVIRDMTRLANRTTRSTWGRASPTSRRPTSVKDAAARAIADDHNQYPITWGVPAFREAIAAAYRRDYGMTVDPETEICVTCGSTEAMIAVDARRARPRRRGRGVRAVLRELRARLDPAGAVPELVSLRPPDWTFDDDELRAAFTAHACDRDQLAEQPTGKVFSREELALIAELCVEHDAIAITDEIYEHITYDGAAHVPIATLPGMARAHGHDQRPVEDLLGHRVARGLGDRSPRR